jgi:tetratricopeptide (TPR) repeat protein
MELRMDATLSLRRLLETELAPVSTKVKKLDAEKPVAQKPAVEKPASKAGKVASSPPAPAAAPMQPPDAAQVAQRQQQAGKDAIAHAQGLWNAGSRDSAIDLMQEVLAATERAATAAPTPANVQLLGQMVRELTRMQLMESRPAPVLELLTRLEPVLGNQADLWAVRANAAQRLGRHQDSVHAYMTALQSRPNEQRWLLGAAVSLAALGQTASAADMATKARAVGVVSKDVLAYLRQMGVLVKD